MSVEKNLVGSAQYLEEDEIIQGWFFDTTNINEALSAKVYINNQLVSKVKMDMMREDIAKQGTHPTGKVGFRLQYKISENDKIILKFKNYDYEYQIENNINSNIKKRKLCIMHIGMHKTGSSSIQHNLYQKKFSNFSYFDLGTENHSIPIYSYLADNPYNYHIHKRLGRTKSDVDNYNKQFIEKFENHMKNNKEFETFILSGEDICVLSPQSLRKLKKFLLKYFHKIKIVGYVREPISYMTSEFQERVKIGLHTFNINHLYSSYKNKFEKFDHIFGKENVELFLFDPKQLHNNDVTSDFLFNMQLIESCETDFKRTNESLSLEATSIMYLFNKCKYEYKILELRSKKYQNFQQYILPFMQKIGKSKLKFSNDLLLNIIQHRTDDIGWIESRLGTKFHSSLSSDFTIESEKDLLETGLKNLESLDENNYQRINEIINLDLLIHKLDIKYKTKVEDIDE